MNEVAARCQGMPSWGSTEHHSGREPVNVWVDCTGSKYKGEKPCAFYQRAPAPAPAVDLKGMAAQPPWSILAVSLDRRTVSLAPLSQAVFWALRV